MTCTGDLEMTE